MARYVNVKGELTQELISSGNTYKVSKISLANLHATIACTVDLYIQHTNMGSFHLLKQVELPVGTSLIYSDFTPQKHPGFGLFIKLTKGASEIPIVDVIIS